MKSIVNWDKLHLFLDKYPAKPYNSSLKKTYMSTLNSKTLLLPTQDCKVILGTFPLYSTSHCFVETFINICIVLIVVPCSYTGKKIRCKSQHQYIIPFEVKLQHILKREDF